MGKCAMKLFAEEKASLKQPAQMFSILPTISLLGVVISNVTFLHASHGQRQKSPHWQHFP